MAIQSMQLDPNAASYTDDEIVGKVNSATAAISRSDAIDGAALGDCDLDDVADGTTNKGYTATEQTKLGTVEDSATADQTGGEIKTAYEGEANAYTDTKDTKLGTIEESATVDQTGDEIVSAVNAGSSSITREDALSQDDLNIVKTNPAGGEYKIKNVHRDSSGKMDIEYDDSAV